MVSLVYATPVEAKKPLRWESACSINPPYAHYNPPWDRDNPTWTGTVTREDGAVGTFAWLNYGAIFMGGVQQFYGIWWAMWDDDVYVEGTHVGTFRYANSKFTINGRVTIATLQYSHLEGRKIHNIGYVDWEGGTYGIGYSENVFQIN